MSLPNSLIRVCEGVKLDNRYQHTIHFSSRVDQLDYFIGKSTRAFADYTYIRKNSAIQVQAPLRDALLWTYLIVDNPKDRSEMFYFITDIRYVNDEVTELVIELDVMQTYAFHYTLLPSFVEREHCNSDTVGANTVDEGLELGPLVNAGVEKIEELDDLCLLIQSNIYIDESVRLGYGVDVTVGTIFEGVYSGLRVSAVLPEDYQAFSTLLRQLDGLNASGGIINMWMYPKALVNMQKQNESDVCYHVLGVKEKTFYMGYYASHSDSLFQGYKPRNKKLYCYPYNYLYMSNNMGGYADFHYERFNTDTDYAEFKLIGGVSPDSSVEAVPYKYKSSGYNHEERLALTNFPTCAWNSDAYLVWLAQNQNSHQVAMNQATYNAGMGAMQAVASIPTGNIGGAVGGLNTSINAYFQQQSILAQRKDMSTQPMQAHGNSNVSTNIFSGNQTFTFYHRTITAEYARIIDEYFDMYGYKVNRVKVPNRYARHLWTYTKTIGCKCSGPIPINDLRLIESIFDNGITFWRDGDKIAQYANDNPCVTGGE